MGRATYVPITGAVLKWALDESGYSRADFLKKFKPAITSETLDAWIAESEQPTKTQFSRMVEVLKRPSAMFFLAAPPAAALPPNFRRAPGPKPRDVSPDERVAIRWALQIQESLRTSLVGSGADPVALPRATPQTAPVAVANDAREFLGVTIAEQRRWKDRNAAFKGWRDAFERAGIIVLNLELGKDALRGFSSPDDYAPLVAVNTWYNFAARSYSLAHELGHLVARRLSSCWGFAGPGDVGEAGSERWCESFAAEFLLPRDAVREYLTGLDFQPTGMLADLEFTEQLAKTFHVSARAAALRLIQLGYSPDSLYGLVDAEFAVVDQKPVTKGGGGRNRVERRLAELGTRGVEVFVDGIHTGSLEKHESLRVLKMHPDEFPALERRLMEKAS